MSSSDATHTDSGRFGSLATQGLGNGYRALVTKVGLDGHDRGVKIVARILRDAGFEVIYGGLRQSPETIAESALQEDVDVVGLSLHSGGHLSLAPAVISALRSRGLEVPVVVGGIIPSRDIPRLRELGVAEVLTPGASATEVVEAVTRAIETSPSRSR
jgi:methylmalonyl-CoA mutase C-terminal domain/subunit